MLRVGPNGIQRVIPKSLQKSNGGGDGGADRKPAAAGGTGIVPGGAGAPGVLSFKTVVGKTPGARPPTAQAPLTPAAAPRAKPPPPFRREVKEEEQQQEESDEPENKDLDAGGEWKAEAQLATPSAKAAPGTMMPTAKRPPPSKAPPPKASGATGQSEQGSKEEDEVMDTDDWKAQFEKKWKSAMEGGHVEGLPKDGGQPPAKRPRTASGLTPPTPSTANGRTAPKQPTGPPPKHLMTPATPKGEDAAGTAVAAVGDLDAKLREEQPEWATRCTIEAAKPGQPQRLTLSMAEVGLGDDGITEWCRWMERRLAARRPGGAAAGGRARFRAGTIDFSENQLSVSGVKALFATLEKCGVRGEVLRLTGNNIGNEGVRCIAKFLTSSSQAPALELYLSRNKVTVEGVKWLLGSLAVHPAYPVWNNETERFVPLWLRIDNNKFKAGAGYTAIEASLSSLSCTVCTGIKRVNVGCIDELKHNCVVHLAGWTAPEGSDKLPEPTPQPRPLFAQPGRGAARPPPSGVEDPVREEPRVIYEDDDLAVVLKPAGWSCLPQPKGIDPSWARLKPLARRQKVGDLLMQAEGAPPLQAWLLLHFGADPNCDASRDQGSDRGLAHRLDLDTSGPILVGKTLTGYEHARKQVMAGLLKDYVALVRGTLPTERGEIVAPIDASAYASLKRVTVDASGQPATTVWESIAEYESPDNREERYTLVQCRVGTLRTHQIRAHLEHIGHPVVGDRVYGDVEPPSFCPRIFLHKSRIGFFNMKGQTCIESCSLQTAPDLWNSLGCLRKVGGMAARGCGAPGL
mmetsp:Transcript_113444/g.301458  ORF Transcript_113444/g.301458 Transcript_113444/m.301458 type:complete len:800 (-) Transcript_113444:198-2597(-)